MKLADKYRALKEDWPEASKWAVPVWIAAILLIAGMAWNIYQSWRSAAAAPPPLTASHDAQGDRLPAAWIREAAVAARMFPSDPPLWQLAGRLLTTADPPAAQKLLTLAEAVRPGATVANQAGAAAAFALDRDAQGSALVRAVLESSSPALDGSESALARACAGAPDQAAAYAGWLMIQSRWLEALGWIDRLPPAVGGAPQIRDLRLELLCRIEDFKGIRSQLVLGNGAREYSDPVDLAVAATIAGGQGRPELAQGLWSAALDACGSNPTATRIVLRLAYSSGLDLSGAQALEAALAKRPADPETMREFKLWMGFRQ